MARFLIEVPHEGTKRGCAQTVDLFFRTGSHFLTHADWGCKDGVHKSWIIVDVGTKDEARNIVPPSYRSQANIVQLNAFTAKDLESLLRDHGT